MLPDSDLPVLCDALRSGRLSIPMVAASLEQLLGHAVSTEVLRAFEHFASLQFSGEQVATVLDMVFQDRKTRPRLEDAVDLVTSGPEAPGIANRDTRVVVRELFANAQVSVLIVGYAVYQGRSIFEALADRMAATPALKVQMFLNISRVPGDTTLTSVLVRRFTDNFRQHHWPPERPLPQLFYDPRSLDVGPQEKSVLHAKCIVVDRREAFVSSANFTDAAQNRNLEIGLLVKSPPLAEKLQGHFDSLVSHRILVSAS